MKRIQTLSLFLLFSVFISIPVFAQTESLEEVLETHFEVVGQENLANVHSIKQTGTVMTQGLSIPMTMFMKRPNMMRINANIGGAEAVFMAYDGTNGWAVQPWTGSIDPIDLPEDQLKDAMQQSDLDGALFNYKEKGHSLELEGTEEVEGTETYKLKLTMKSGDVMYYFLDAEAYVPIKITSKTTMQGQEFEQEQFLSNYKMVEGFAVAHSIETKVMGNTAMQITVNEVEVNPEIENSYFSKPGSNK